MKWYTMIAATVLLLVLVGCGGNMYETSDTQDEDTETVDDQTGTNEDEDTTVPDNESEENPSEQGDSEPTDQQDSDDSTGENDSDSNEDIDEDGTTGATAIEDTTPIEFEVPEDTTTYDSGLVFVKQEDELWRVVDRMGNVYRVSTSYTPISVGTVADVAHVSTNEDGDVQVELEHSFTQHENAVVLEGDADTVAREFVTDLLDATSSIVDYRIRSMDVETRGKGMLIVTMKYDVEPGSTDSDWPSTDESGYTQLMNYQFVVYGYETTWVVPTYPSLFDGSVLDDGHNTAVNSGVSTQGNNGQQGSNSDAQGSNSGGNNGTTNETVQVDLYQTGNNHYYYVRELEEQSQMLQGSDTYEYTSILYSDKDNERLPLTSGVRNTDYKVLKIQNGHIYLLQEAWEPFSESFPSGLGVIDMKANSYERLYQGAVKEAATTSQNIYVFATDALFAIDVVNSRLVTVADLPETMNFRMHNMSVTGIENNVMEVQVDGDRGTENYAINLGTGDIVDITQ